MALGIILLVIGAALMLVGVCMLWEWLSGSGKFFAATQRDRSAPQSDFVLMTLCFLSLVIAAVLGGAILIVFGLARLQ